MNKGGKKERKKRGGRNTIILNSQFSFLPESKQSGQSSTPQTEGTFTDSTTREVVLKLSRSKDKPKPRNPADALVLALQCLMLKEKFACLAKQSRANQVSGFAAPVRGRMSVRKESLTLFFLKRERGQWISNGIYAQKNNPKITQIQIYGF